MTAEAMGVHGHNLRPCRLWPDQPICLSVCQHVGSRKSQEDRWCIARLSTREPQLFACVFDGTVGDYASDNIQELLPKTMEKNVASALPSRALAPGSSEHAKLQREVERIISKSYVEADRLLLRQCAQKGDHYAACTGVSAAVFADQKFMVLSWIGDSRIVLVRKNPHGGHTGEFVTQDHRPDLEEERARIEAHGGTVECLQNHGGKPYIRGGDFMLRKALKEKPMQLQYSRAFGGKDLKMFGLTAEPSHHTCSTSSVTHIVMASDGVWDMVNADECAAIVGDLKGTPPYDTASPELVLREVLLRHDSKGSSNKADNLTCMVITL